MTEPNWRLFSDWCLQLGRPACDRCPVADCPCPGCVAKRSEPAQNKGNQRGSAVSVRDNRDAPAGCVNTAARADHLPELAERG